MNLIFGFSLRNLQKIMICLLAGHLMILGVPNEVMAQMTDEKQFFCFLKPHNLSLESQLRDIENERNNFYTLKTLAQVLNPNKDLKVSIDSYNVFLPWKKTPSKQWLINHCYLIGSVSREQMRQKLSDPEFDLHPASLNLQNVEDFLNPRKNTVSPVVAKSSFSTNPAPSPSPNPIPRTNPKPIHKPESEPPIKAALPSSPAEPILINIEVARPSPAKARGPWAIEMTPFMGVEFINGKGIGLTNKIQSSTLGAELKLQRSWGSSFSIYAKGRFQSLAHTNTKAPSEIELDLETDHSYMIGFDISFLSNLKLGLGYKYASWTLFERTTPIFVLEPLDQKIKALVFSFDWYFKKQKDKGWGLAGDYGFKHPTDDGNSFQDFRTALFYRWNSLNQIYNLSFGYELYKYKYDNLPGPSSIEEINRNRYILSFGVLY